jgi:hypothetical protein
VNDQDPFPDDDPFLPRKFPWSHCDTCGTYWRNDLGHDCRGPARSAPAARRRQEPWSARRWLVLFLAVVAGLVVFGAAILRVAEETRR